MATYHVVQIDRDRICGWVIQKIIPDPKGYPQPRKLYQTRDQAEAEAGRLNAIESA